MQDADRRLIIIGVGNPILADDSVGIKIARSLKERLCRYKHVVVSETCAGGIRLLDELVGYDMAIIVDAIVTDNGKPGTVYLLSPSDIVKTRNTFSTHDTNLSTALEMGRMLGLSLPQEIKIWAIEVEDVTSFSQELTEDVEKAVPIVVERIIEDLKINIKD